MTPRSTVLLRRPPGTRTSGRSSAAMRWPQRMRSIFNRAGALKIMSCDSIIETGGVLARHKIILCVQALLLSFNFGYPIFAPYIESKPDKATVSGVVTLSGAEAGGIDIRHRGERVGVISGVVSGPAGSETIPVSVMLYGLPSGTEAASS